MSLASIAGAAVGALATGMYLDGRFHVRNDIRLEKRKYVAMLAMRDVAQRVRENKLLMYNILEDRAGTPEGDNIWLIFEGRQWTFTEFYAAIQPVANWLLKDLGIKKGEVVVLDGVNTPEYLLIFFALEAVGATSALLNCNLTGNALVHSVQLSSARYVLADEEAKSLVSPVESELKEKEIDVVYYSSSSIEALKDTDPLPKERRIDLEVMGPAHLLYTSGTTGLPKGVVFPRFRAIMMGRAVSSMLSLKPGDRMYTCLPLYHASGLWLCTMPCLFAGATVALGRKFSHSSFWQEVHQSGATHIQYVGELCRYLVNAPPSPLDRGHGVRMAWGNGMRSDVWERFRERFGIECINELYGASDGMNMMTNPNRGDFSRDAIALRGPLWHLLNRQERRVLIDPDTQELMRGKDGWAIEAKAGEPGEIIVRMNPTDPDTGTPKYFNNKAATEKRRVSNVFGKGDIWFRSGDLFKLDSEGRLFFVDRLGDTYRWHSENVSTNEVSDVVGKFPQVAETNVYGVLVPKADGRAGCAALVLTGETVDFAALAAHCLARLPRYAVPLFLRITKGLEYTGTHKLQKQKLRSEGIELATIEASGDDQMYWLPPGSKTYVPFTQKDLDGIKAGSVRL
ncbi:fatty-acyl-CoA synthase [Nemania sp. NC0429]|nr:fatty-acyl-CoA synthase [Nemania sp. NC0429]